MLHLFSSSLFSYMQTSWTSSNHKTIKANKILKHNILNHSYIVAFLTNIKVTFAVPSWLNSTRMANIAFRFPQILFPVLQRMVECTHCPLVPCTMSNFYHKDLTYTSQTHTLHRTSKYLSCLSLICHKRHKACLRLTCLCYKTFLLVLTYMYLMGWPLIQFLVFYLQSCSSISLFLMEILERESSRSLIWEPIDWRMSFWTSTWWPLFYYFYIRLYLIVFNSRFNKVCVIGLNKCIRWCY